MFNGFNKLNLYTLIIYHLSLRYRLRFRQNLRFQFAFTLKSHRIHKILFNLVEDNCAEQ